MNLNKYQKEEGEGLRAAFKDGLAKLMQISTREQGNKQLRTLITQNKTTINLRIWLSVLSQNRHRHSESEINVLDFIVQQYGKGLLDPLDKIPTLQKTVFRITELLIKLYFSQDNQNVALALQKVWVDLYLVTLKDEQMSLKKKLLYDCLQAIINGGAGRISQCTSQVVMEGVLQASLNRQDQIFFKEIAKRALVLFLKTTIEHPAVLTCLQTILGYFNAINLIPLLENIVSKILSYIAMAQNNSIGYRIKAEISNALALIGEQLDQSGVAVQEKVIKALEGLATDKVWAVQATGRKALTVWKNKKKEWEKEYISKNQQFYPSAQQFYKPQEEQVQFKRPLTAENFRPKTGDDIGRPDRSPPQLQKYPDYSQAKYLHKNTGIGGGNTAQSFEQYYERQKPQDTYSKKMEEIKKSIYQPKEDFTEYDETVQWEGPLPTSQVPIKNQQVQPPPELSEIKSQPEGQNAERADEEAYLLGWQKIMDLHESGRKQQSAKAILDLDDDLYFLRYMLKYGKGLLGELTRPTAAKILKKMLSINKTHFMQQLLLKFAAETAKSATGNLLTTQQTLSISDNLLKCGALKDLQRPAAKVRKIFQRSLQ